MFDEIKKIVRDNFGSSDIVSEFLSMPSLKVTQISMEEQNVLADIKEKGKADSYITSTEIHYSHCLSSDSSCSSISISSNIISKPKENDIVIRMVSETGRIADRVQQKKTMKEIYKTFIFCQKDRDFEKCNIILSNVDIANSNPTVLLSLLMASYSIKHCLSSRPFFYEKVYRLFILLYGLEEANALILKLR